MTRPDWDTFFLRQVDALAARTTCDRGRSAALFVRDRDILSSGYVGAPPGFPHCDDVGHLWSDDGKHCLRTVHAEQNAVIRAARNGASLRAATLYCTMEPCLPCAMTLIGLEVSRVVAKHAYHAATPSRLMLRQAGIPLETLSERSLYKADWTSRTPPAYPGAPCGCGKRNCGHVWCPRQSSWDDVCTC